MDLLLDDKELLPSGIGPEDESHLFRLLDTIHSCRSRKEAFRYCISCMFSSSEMCRSLKASSPTDISYESLLKKIILDVGDEHRLRTDFDSDYIHLSSNDTIGIIFDGFRFDSLLRPF